MNYYIELTIIPNEEIPIYDIWPKLYTQLHLALVVTKDSRNQVSIGVSFPQYKSDKMGGKVIYCLGVKLRVFAHSADELQKLDLDKWLARLTDYVHWTNTKPVPEKITGHATYGRYQPKASKERLARRYAKYKKISYEEALQHYSSTEKEEVTLPFIRLKSLSKGQEFCLWIKKTPAAAAAGSKYGSYGLSNITTVPEF